MSGEHLTDLAASISISSYQAFPGETVKFVVTADNFGPSNARDVYVEVVLPQEVEYQNLRQMMAY